MSVPLTQALGGQIFFGICCVPCEIPRHTAVASRDLLFRLCAATSIFGSPFPFQIGLGKYAHPVGRHMALSRALASTAPVGLYPLIEMPHCSRAGPQTLCAANPASSGHQALDAGPSPGNPKQQNHLLR